MKRRFAFVLALLILHLQSYAQARILIESRFQTGGEGLSGIVERCAAFAAGLEGFEAAYPGGSPDEASLAAVLRCDSILDKGDYRLKLALFAPGEDQAALAELGLSGRLSLDFDDRLIAAVRELVSAASLEPSRTSAEIAWSGRAGEALLEEPPVAEPEPSVLVLQPPASPTPSIPSPLRFALSLTSAPLFILGAASEYFRYGIDGSCFFGLRFDASALELEAGLRAGYDLVYSAGLVAGELHLASLGVELRGSWPAAGLFSLRLRAGGGPLYLAAASESAGLLGKVLPFCSAGLGFDFKPSAGFTLGLETGFLVVFERNLPLFGLAPGLSAAWRL
jgi:hypothetical protein